MVEDHHPAAHDMMLKELKELIQVLKELLDHRVQQVLKVQLERRAQRAHKGPQVRKVIREHRVLMATKV